MSLSLDQLLVISSSNETVTPLVEVGILSKCALPYIRHILAVSPQGCNRVNAASSLGNYIWLAQHLRKVFKGEEEAVALLVY